jgi:cobalt-zinc-cadmium efflux system membrane fusion protein
MYLWSTLWVAGVCWLLPTTLLAHGGEDHSQEIPAPALTATLEPRLETASRAVELVAILQKDGLLIYLDRYASNEPVSGATLTVDVDNQTLTAAPAGPGLYRLAEAAGLKPGNHELVFTIAAPGLNDVLISTLTVPAETAASTSKVMTAPHDYLLLGGAGVIGLLAGLILGRRRSPAVLVLLALSLPVLGLAHEGEDHSSPPVMTPTSSSAPTRLPDGSLFVPKPVQRLLGIRTVPAEVRDLPNAVELNGHLIADPRHSGRVQATQNGLLEMASDGLPHIGQAVRAGQVLIYLVPMANPAAREPLRAPVDGIISMAGAVAGQVVEARDILFEIIDPRQWWAEAVVYDATLNQRIASATAQTFDGQVLPLQLVGMGYQRRGQGLPMHFRVEGNADSLSAGQPLRILAQTGESVRGVPLPRDSVIRDTGGETTVWVHTQAEHFAPRRVQVQPVDGATVAVTDGLQPGERVVTMNAAALSQVR